MPHLPEELLERICNDLHLMYEYENAALLSISLVSKAWNRAAQHAIYRSINFGISSDKALLLLHRLIVEPPLRNMIHNVFVETFGMRPDEHEDQDMYDDPALKLPPEVIPAIVEFVNTIDAPEAWQSRMRHELAQGVDDARLALLLCLCSSIETINIGTPYFVDESLLMATFEEARCGSISMGVGPLCPNLREANIRHCDTEMTTHVLGLASLMQHPTLHTLRGYALSCTENDDLSALNPSPLTQVHLQYSNVDGTGLRHLLQSCPSLRSLTLALGDAIVDLGDIDFRALGDAIRAHGTGLIELCLDHEVRWRSSLEIDGAPLGGLRTLANLEKLLIPFVALFGHEDGSALDEAGFLLNTLPSTLHTLGISHADDEVMTEPFGDRIAELLAAPSHHLLSTIYLSRSECLLPNLKNHGWEVIGEKKFDHDPWTSWSVLRGVVAVS